MGAWGPAIFSDDLAADVRVDGFESCLQGPGPTTDEEATRRVIDSYRDLDEEEEPTLWLALAATQSSLGRLDEEVKRRALSVIDDGRGLEPWGEAGLKDLEKRKTALAKLRDQLVGPQPPRKTLRRPWRHATDLEARRRSRLRRELATGLSRSCGSGRIDDDRAGAAPGPLEWLDWRRQVDPGQTRELGQLKVRPPEQARGGPPDPATFRPAKYRKKDPCRLA